MSSSHPPLPRTDIDKDALAEMFRQVARMQQIVEEMSQSLDRRLGKASSHAPESVLVPADSIDQPIHDHVAFTPDSLAGMITDSESMDLVSDSTDVAKVSTVPAPSLGVMQFSKDSPVEEAIVADPVANVNQAIEDEPIADLVLEYVDEPQAEDNIAFRSRFCFNSILCDSHYNFSSVAIASMVSSASTRLFPPPKPPDIVLALMLSLEPQPLILKLSLNRPHSTVKVRLFVIQCVELLCYMEFRNSFEATRDISFFVLVVSHIICYTMFWIGNISLLLENSDNRAISSPPLERVVSIVEQVHPMVCVAGYVQASSPPSVCENVSVEGMEINIELYNVSIYLRFFGKDWGNTVVWIVELVYLLMTILHVLGPLTIENIFGKVVLVLNSIELSLHSYLGLAISLGLLDSDAQVVSHTLPTRWPSSSDLFLCYANNSPPSTKGTIFVFACDWLVKTIVHVAVQINSTIAPHLFSSTPQPSRLTMADPINMDVPSPNAPPVSKRLHQLHDQNIASILLFQPPNTRRSRVGLDGKVPPFSQAGPLPSTHGRSIHASRDNNTKIDVSTVMKMQLVETGGLYEDVAGDLFLIDVVNRISTCLANWRIRVSGKQIEDWIGNGVHGKPIGDFRESGTSELSNTSTDVIRKIRGAIFLSPNFDGDYIGSPHSNLRNFEGTTSVINAAFMQTVRQHVLLLLERVQEGKQWDPGELFQISKVIWSFQFKPWNPEQNSDGENFYNLEDKVDCEGVSDDMVMGLRGATNNTMEAIGLAKQPTATDGGKLGHCVQEVLDANWNLIEDYKEVSQEFNRLWDPGGYSFLHWNSLLVWVDTLKYAYVMVEVLYNYNLEDKVDFDGVGIDTAAKIGVQITLQIQLGLLLLVLWISPLQLAQGLGVSLRLPADSVTTSFPIET